MKGAFGLDRLAFHQVEEWVVLLHTLNVFDMSATFTQYECDSRGRVTGHMELPLPLTSPSGSQESGRVVLTFSEWSSRVRLFRAGMDFQDLLWASIRFDGKLSAWVVGEQLLTWMGREGWSLSDPA